MRRTALVSCFLFAASLAASAPAPSAAEGAWLPFVLPWDDGAPGVTDVSFLLEAPAGKSGAVAARDGHFYTGDRRIRFWGVNFCFGACFPDEDVAPKVAAQPEAAASEKPAEA